MPHRILHVVDSLDRYTSAEDLLTLLTAWDSDAWQHLVVVLGSGRGGLAEEIRATRCEVFALDRRWKFDPTTLARLVSSLREHTPDIVHTWDPASWVYTGMASKACHFGHLVAECSQIESRLLTTHRLIRRPTRWVAPSERVAKSVGSRVANDSVVVIPPAARLPSDQLPSREKLLAELSLSIDAPLIGTVGPLRAPAGVKELIWAADMVRVLHPTMRYLIAGDGSERRHLEQFSRTAADPTNICFLGDTDRWPEIVPHLHVYWQGTTLGGESCTAMLTAMAAGVPVVATDTPQHRDWIEPEQTGYLVDHAARSDRTRITDHLLTEAASCDSIAKTAKVQANSKHNPQTRAAAYRQLYEQL